MHLHHTSVVVDDLETAIAFFAALGLELEGQAPIEGAHVDRLNALDGMRVAIAMMRTPEGDGRLELTKFHAPAAVVPEPKDALGNVLGLRSIMFNVDDVDATLDALRAHGGVPIGTVEDFGSHRLCYVRGPAGIIVALAQDLG